VHVLRVCRKILAGMLWCVLVVAVPLAIICCAAHVTSANRLGEGICSGQYFDYLHVLDKCVGPKVWAKLK
jgi:hypothetical protein